MHACDMHERCHLQGDKRGGKRKRPMIYQVCRLRAESVSTEYTMEYMQVVDFALLSTNNSSTYSRQSTPYGADTSPSTAECLEARVTSSHLQDPLGVYLLSTMC